jgi:hypothetical protein
VLDLDVFYAAARLRVAEWEAEALRCELSRSLDDGRNKASAWVTVEGPNAGGGLVVWDSGEGDLEIVRPDGTVVLRHLAELADRSEIEALLDELVRAATDRLD